MLFMAFGRQGQNLGQKLGDMRTYGRAVSGPAVDGAGEDHASITESITVMGIIIPAEHIGEGIVAVHLRVAAIVLGEELSIGYGHRPEVGVAQHHASSSP